MYEVDQIMINDWVYIYISSDRQSWQLENHRVDGKIIYNIGIVQQDMLDYQKVWFGIIPQLLG